MPSVSLKSLLPALGRIVDELPGALYERQRMLVREGLLEEVTGHGPGSGVRATPETVAVLLIGVLASESLSKASLAVRRIVSAVPAGVPTGARRRCALTGGTTFKEALINILSEEQLLKRVTTVEVVY